MLKLSAYLGCSTRHKNVERLKAHEVPFVEIAIRETPPTVVELSAMLEAHEGDRRPLVNTSGQDYRAMGLKDILVTMNAGDALNLLSQHGNLVKRPFAIDQAKGVYLVGFEAAEWEVRFQV